MKRTLIALALILAGTSAASAQGYGANHYRGHGYNPHGPVFVHRAPRHIYMPSRPRHFGFYRFNRHPGFWRPWHRPTW